MQLPELACVNITPVGILLYLPVLILTQASSCSCPPVLMFSYIRSCHQNFLSPFSSSSCLLKSFRNRHSIRRHPLRLRHTLEPQAVLRGCRCPGRASPWALSSAAGHLCIDESHPVAPRKVLGIKPCLLPAMQFV